MNRLIKYLFPIIFYNIFAFMFFFNCSSDENKKPENNLSSTKQEGKYVLDKEKLYFPVLYAGYIFDLLNQNNSVKRTYEIMKYNPKKATFTYIQKIYTPDGNVSKTYNNCKVEGDYLVLYSFSKKGENEKLLEEKNYDNGLKLFKVMNLHKGDTWEYNDGEYKATFTITEEDYTVKTKAGDYKTFKVKEIDTKLKGSGKGTEYTGYYYLTKYYGIVRVENGKQVFTLSKIQEPPSLSDNKPE